MYFRTCPCGKTRQHGRCGTTPICENICDRLLNCQSHRCKHTCHLGQCEPCKIQIQQKCGCQNPIEKSADCDVGVETFFSCGNSCGKRLKCGNHFCGKICHAQNEDCERCERSPELVKTCPCGKSPLEAGSRQSCLDPIPSCGQKCEKSLICGHSCQHQCHEGECQKCPLSTKVRLSELFKRLSKKFIKIIAVNTETELKTRILQEIQEMIWKIKEAARKKLPQEINISTYDLRLLVK